MFERYTEKARRVIFFARYEASMFGTPSIEPEHVLLGIAREDGALLSRFLHAKRVVERLREQVKKSVGVREKIGPAVELPLSPNTKKVLAYAHEESDRLNHRHIGTEHFLLGLLREEGTLAEKILCENGLELARVREMIERGEVGSSPAESNARASFIVGRASNEPAAAEAATSMRLEHIGIATRSIDDALRFWRDALGLEVRHTETVEEQGVRVAMLPVGEPRVELLEPTGENSPVAKFLEKSGAGIHHIAVRVPDIREALARLKEKGARLIDEEPRVGAGGCLVAFVHPAASGGVLLELVEHTAESRASEKER